MSVHPLPSALVPIPPARPTEAEIDAAWRALTGAMVAFNIARRPDTARTVAMAYGRWLALFDHRGPR